MSELSVPTGPGSISNLRKVIRGQESCVTWATCCCPFLFHSKPTENTNASIRALGFIQLHGKLNEMHAFCFSFLHNQRRGLTFVIKMMTHLDNCVLTSSKEELSREMTGKWVSALKGYIILLKQLTVPSTSREHSLDLLMPLLRSGHRQTHMFRRLVSFHQCELSYFL